MTRIVSEPYLGSELAGLALLSLLWLSAGAERRRMLLAGLLPLLLLPMVPLMDAGYWAPRRLGGASIGLEDGLYMAQVGAAAWFFASRASRFDAAATPSASMAICSPSMAIAGPASPPKPPRMTLTKLRFIALHMM